jgi:hypothetical protein
MQQVVATYVGRCEVCDRVRSSFNTLTPQLRPLLIMGLGYRWSLDFVGPLMTTSQISRSSEINRFPYVFHQLVVSWKFRSIFFFAKFV